MDELIEYTSFLYPEAFVLFGFIPLLIAWYVFNNKKSRSTITVSSAEAFRRHSIKSRLIHLPFIIRLIAICFLIFAIARPQKRNDEQFTGGEGIDIVLSMDVSGSMMSRDFQPNRLEVAKEVASEFIRSRPVDRIGLVIFAGESYTLSPITTDKNMLLQQINGLKSGLLEDGTLIGEGLALAVDRLQSAKAPSKVIILLTDGRERRTRNTLIDPLTALEIAKTRGVKVYTIGMAREGYVGIQEQTGIDETLISEELIDEGLLERIALETGGQFFRARDKSGLEKIYSEIDRLEKVKIERSSFKRVREQFFVYLALAVGLIVLELVLRFTYFRKFP